MLRDFHKKTFKRKQNTQICEKIINFSHNTSEKIEDHYLKDFLISCITSSNQQIKLNSKLFYTYFEKDNLYEIFFIENHSHKEIPLPFIFSYLHSDELNEVFLYENFFIVYTKGEFRVFKEISEEISSSDILNFILHRYDICIDKVHKFDDLDMDKLKNDYLNTKSNNTLPLINLKKDKRSIYLFTFISFVLLIPLIHFNFFHKKQNQLNVVDKKLLSLQKRYENLLERTDKKKASYIVNTLLQLKNLKLKLQTINLNKNKIHLFIQAKDKIALLEFIENYDGEISIDKLNFNQKTKFFDMELTIVI